MLYLRCLYCELLVFRITVIFRSFSTSQGRFSQQDGFLSFDDASLHEICIKARIAMINTLLE